MRERIFMMDGTLSIRSMPGAGTTVSALVPLTGESTRGLCASCLRMITALLPKALIRILEPKCELVGIVEDGFALLDAAAEERPDVIVTDISMPGLNGIEALEELKKNDPEVQVVCLTMHTDVAYPDAHSMQARWDMCSNIRPPKNSFWRCVSHCR